MCVLGGGADRQLTAAAAAAGSDDDNDYYYYYYYDNDDDTDHDVDEPIFRPAPTNITVSAGDRASLKCRIDNVGTNTVRPSVVCWLRSTAGGTMVFDQRTNPVLRSACSRRVTTMWVNRTLQVSQLDQLSLSSFRGR